jgi:hypothetical protein
MVPHKHSYWQVVEALTSGLAYSTGLWWGSVCLLASFRPSYLSAPYWRVIPNLRSDTSGVLAFFAFAVFFSYSEFLRLRRQRPLITARGGTPPKGVMVSAVLAISETVTVLATGLVIYISVNAITHPATLNLQATHLAPWPTEGTLRMIALLLCVCSVSTLRFLLAGRRAVAGSHSDLTTIPPTGSAVTSTTCSADENSARKRRQWG